MLALTTLRHHRYAGDRVRASVSPMTVLVDETVGGTEVLVIVLDVPLVAFLYVVTVMS